MAKFYVQSGNVKMVLQARDSRSAAIWAAHRTLGDNMPFIDDQPVEEVTSKVEALRLDETIRVSQRGFDRADAKKFETLDIVSEWSRLLVALERLSAISLPGV
jgi:hypothetical protein